MQKTAAILMLIVGALWEGLNYLSLLDFIVSKLQSEGPTGSFLAHIIKSPLPPLVLLAVAGVFLYRSLQQRKSAAPLNPSGGININVSPNISPVISPTISPNISAENNSPKLILEYSPLISNPMHCSGFHLRTEGKREAFNVEITSEETDGDDHPRIRMEWENPGHPIGQNRVPVIVHCVYKVNDTWHRYSSFAANQINLFFQHKRDNPRELIVTIGFTDVDGDPCPSKRFKIAQDVWNPGKISCNPVKN